LSRKSATAFQFPQMRKRLLDKLASHPELVKIHALTTQISPDTATVCENNVFGPFQLNGRSRLDGKLLYKNTDGWRIVCVATHIFKYCLIDANQPSSNFMRGMCVCSYMYLPTRYHFSYTITDGSARLLALTKCQCFQPLAIQLLRQT
jgi:hypothetical protein